MEVEIAATALLNLSNTLFKLPLVGRQTDRRMLVRFAVRTALAAVLGRLSGLPVVATWQGTGELDRIEALPLAIGPLSIAFAVPELSSAFGRMQFARAIRSSAGESRLFRRSFGQ